MSEMGAREFTELNLRMELGRLANNYMVIWEEYYKTGSRDSAFLKDLADCLIGIGAVYEVYTNNKNIHPEYALEKLKNSKSYIDSAIRYYEMKEKEENEKNIDE